MRRVRSGQADLAFEVFGTGKDGNGDGRAGRVDVMLLHAGVCDRRGWGELIDALTHVEGMTLVGIADPSPDVAPPVGVPLLARW